MKKILVLLVCAFLTQSAFADSSSTVELVGLGMKPEIVKYLVGTGLIQKNNVALKFANATPAATALSVLRLDTSNNVHVQGISGKGISLDIAGTPVASAGIAPYVPTMAATPVAGTNDLHYGDNAVPTAAANTAACLPNSPFDGATVNVDNAMANAVRAKPCGTPGVNGAAAGTYLSVAAWTRATLKYNAGLTTWVGATQVVPTPAGP